MHVLRTRDRRIPLWPQKTEGGCAELRFVAFFELWGCDLGMWYLWGILKMFGGSPEKMFFFFLWQYIISHSNQHFESVTWLSCSFGGFPNEYVICMFLSYGMPTFFLRYFWDPSFGKPENSPCAMDYAKTLVKWRRVGDSLYDPVKNTAEIVSGNLT